MKKIYIAVITLFILIITSFLTYISETSNQEEVTYATSTENIEVRDNTPVIIAENPEGEANPDVMKLDMKTWNWISTTYNDGKVIKPNTSDRFKLTFTTNNKTFSVSTDCNGVGGEYTVDKNKIFFDKMMSTLMHCEGSQESDFSKSLSQVSSYHFTNKGELVFDLKYDSGVMIFR